MSMSSPSNQPSSLIPFNRERLREKLKVIDANVEKSAQAEKMQQLRLMVHEETKAILIPALQESLAEFTLQFIPDPRLATSIERTAQEMERVNENMATLAEAQQKAVDQAKKTTDAIVGAMEEMVTETVTAVSNHGKMSTDELLTQQRLMAKRQRFWTVMTMSIVCLVVVVGSLGVVGYLRWEQRTKLGSEIASLRMDRQKAQTEAEQANKQLIDLKTQRDSFATEIDKLKSDETAVRLQIKQAADSAAAVAQVRSQAQSDIRKMQQIQEQNRFKLLEGQGGNVFVEIPTESKAFTYQGKTYIKVAPEKSSE